MELVETVHPESSPKQKQKRKRVNYALAATLLATGTTLNDELALRVGAKNANVLRVGLTKRGVTRKYANSLPMNANLAKSHAAQVATNAVEILREKLNGELMDQVNALTSKPVSYKSLASRGQGRAATAKTIADTYRALNGSNDQLTVVFGAGRLDESPVIDVTPEKDAPQDIVGD